jgi:D-glycero-alpha-D-manno-heptose-7-phosphate kinase
VIISRTPLRVSLFGGGSDLPAYYRRFGGAVLSTAIEQSVYITVSRKFDDAIRVSYSKTEEVARAADVEHPLVREALTLLKIDGGVEITSVADIPAKGTGLGSSSAFTVGLLNALHAFRGKHVSASDLAQESCHIEIDRCREPIGKQDQYAVAFGGFNFIRFNPDETVEVRKVICRPGLVDELQSHLLFFYTGITRSASAILDQQSANVSRDAGKADATGSLVRLAEQAHSDLCAGSFASIGEMLDEAWQLKKQLAAGVTSDAIDATYSAARAAGAQGGKLLGAGGGGFLMLFAAPDRHDAIRRALGAMRETPLRFAPSGSSIIFVH